jgi:hypothetical protein
MQAGEAYGTHGSDGKCEKNFDHKTESRHYFENVDIDKRIILKWILGKYKMRVWT